MNNVCSYTFQFKNNQKVLDPEIQELTCAKKVFDKKGNEVIKIVPRQILYPDTTMMALWQSLRTLKDKNMTFKGKSALVAKRQLQ